MKHWINAVALICFCSLSAMAAVETQDTLNRSSSSPSSAVSVSSNTPVRVDGTPVAGRTVVEIQNVEISTNNIYCVVGSSFTAPTIAFLPAAPSGHMITPNGGTWTLSLTPYSDNDTLIQNVWCVCDKLNGSCNSVISQFGKK